MQIAKTTGRNASVAKYDILTALGAYALARNKHDQRLVLRLMTLITARYNWGRNQLAVGQREIARLWSVDERTVKREMAKLRSLGWLVVTRQGARGHVTEYRIDKERLLAATQDSWTNVGPDFDMRMQGQPESERIVPMPSRGDIAPPDTSDGLEWSLAQALLHAEDPNTYGSWLRALSRVDRAGGRLTLKAPTRFHGVYVQTHFLGRILTACQAVDGDVFEVIVRD
jgi:DnaA N-terminal domain